MKIAICDDEPADLRLLCTYLHRYDETLQADCFTSGQALLDAFSVDFYELVFLDIEMSAPNGYEVGTRLAGLERCPVIVFTTKTVNYAVRGYGIALRYLLKPVSYSTFESVMHLVRDELLPEQLVIQQRGTQYIFSVREILYFEVFLHRVVIHRRNTTPVELRCSLSELMGQLRRSWFLQCHKSYCVNMDYIDNLEPNCLHLTNGTVIPIGSTRKRQVNTQLQAYLRSKSWL